MRDDFRIRVAASLKPFIPLFEAFESAGHQFYAVGGCVRDWIMDKPPKDIDFCTDALPKKTKAILQACGLKSIAVGEAFGTIATLIDRKSYEITTFRVKESYTRGSRHPSVSYGHDLEQDLERRDLTINAMAVDRYSKLIDPLGGLADIKAKILRVPKSSPERSLEIFADDPLRLLRLARFCARLDFEISPDASSAARSIAGSVLGVSHERWYAELNGILCAPHPEKAFAWLREVGILPLLLPELLPTFSCYRQATSLSCGNFEKSERPLYDIIMDGIKTAEATSSSRWIALCRHLGTPASNDIAWSFEVSRLLAEDLMTRFRFSNARQQEMMRRLRLLPNAKAEGNCVRKIAILLGSELGGWLRDLENSCLTLSPSSQASERQRLVAWAQKLSPYVEDPALAPVRLPAGLSQVLSKRLNLSGKALGLALSRCEEAVLNGDILDDAEPNEFVRYLSDD